MDLMACDHCAQPIGQADFVCEHCRFPTRKGSFRSEVGPLIGAGIAFAVIAAIGIGVAYLLLG